MGIYVKGAFGAFSGKVGNLVGSNWRSIDYLRSRPRPSKKAATELQLAQREKLILVTDFLSPVRDLINIGLNDKGRNKSMAYNIAVMNLIKQLEGVYPNFTIPYSEVKFSKGDLSTITVETGTDMDGNFQVQWSPRLGHTAKLTDKVYLIFYKEEAEDFFVFQDCVRGDAEYSIAPKEMGTGTFQLWTFLFSEDGKKRSKSQYIGAFELD